MKKIIFFICTAVIITTAGTIFASAAPISPGLEVIVSENNMIKTGSASLEFNFSTEDFEKAVGAFDHITIVSLPDTSDGKLMYKNTEVTVNQSLKADELSLLRFKKEGDCTKADFLFSPDDTYTMSCAMILTDKINFPPTANLSNSDISVSTQSGVNINGTLEGNDPENDEIKYEILQYPEYGKISEFDESNGKYCYIPDSKFTGRDSFTYCIRDEFGNYSDEATIEITVDKRIYKDVISDVVGNEYENDILCAVSKELMTVSEENGIINFSPDKEVSRLEFLITTMKSLNASGMPECKATSFSDDNAIPDEYKCYVDSAQKLGIIKGVKNGNEICFEPDRSITSIEAAVILERIIGAGKEDTVSVFENGDDIPSWASQSVSAMCETGIMNIKNFTMPGSVITRSICAGIMNRIHDNYT